MTRFDPDAIIARYLAAFRAANGATTPPDLTYKRGWFILYQHHITQRYRRLDINYMSERLERVAALTPEA